MSNERVIMSSSAVELSEHKTYMDIKQRLCFYGEPNYNGVVLPVDGAEEKAQTLLNQPVVAKYTTTAGKPDLGGHEFSIDRDGNPSFGTVPVGTHIDVSVHEDTVPVNGETKTLPCLFATMRLWTRNKNVVSAVRRLFSEGRLHSSWEVVVSDAEYKDGYKVLKDYAFEGNALLGTNNPPAYGEAAVALSFAESETAPETIIAEALAKDLETEKEDNMMDNTEISTNETVESVAGVQTDEVVVEQSAAVDNKEVELPEQIAKLTSDISERDNALVIANQKISELTAQLDEAMKYKAFYDEAEAKRLAAELAATQERMISDAKKSKLFSEDELASDEIKVLLNAGDETGLKKIIAERFIKSLEDKSEETEVSEVKTGEPVYKAEIPESTKIDNKKFMAMLLGDE